MGLSTIGAVGFWRYSNSRTAQAIALLGRFDQAGFVEGVCPRPTVGRAAVAMLHLEEVTNSIVQVSLNICAHRVAITGMRESNVWCVVMRVRYRFIPLPQMLASSGFDQPVYGVVSVVSTRLDAFILKVDDLLGFIADMGDVAGRIVGVVQVLHLAARPADRVRLRAVAGKVSGIATCEQVDQAEG